jgi:hypothetical protein
MLCLSGCAAAALTAHATRVGGVPCAQYSTCAAYSGASGSDNGEAVAWLASHPLRADYYGTGSSGQLDIAGPVNSITLPLTRIGTIVTIDRSHIIESAEGCAGSSPSCTEQVFLEQVLLSANTAGFFDTRTGTIVFRAGTKSISFEKL